MRRRTAIHHGTMKKLTMVIRESQWRKKSDNERNGTVAQQFISGVVWGRVK
jgi:hypothetical protein